MTSQQTKPITVKEAGRLGGLVKSEKKAKASRLNGLKGGRPKGAKKMKIIQAVLVSILFIGTCLAENYTSQHVGDADFISGDNGYSATGIKVGNAYFYTDNEGNSYTQTQVGGVTFTDGSNDFQSQDIGGVTFIDAPSGSYTSQNVGGVDFISGPNGYSGTGMKVGNVYFYDDNR